MAKYGKKDIEGQDWDLKEGQEQTKLTLGFGLCALSSHLCVLGPRNLSGFQPSQKNLTSSRFRDRLCLKGIRYPTSSSGLCSHMPPPNTHCIYIETNKSSKNKDAH